MVSPLVVETSSVLVRFLWTIPAMYEMVYDLILGVIVVLLVILLLWIATPGKPHYVRASDGSCLRMYDGGRWPVTMVADRYCQ